MTDRIRSVQLTPELHERIKQYASDNNLSVSAAISEVMAAYASGDPLPVRKRRTKRVTIWVNPETYLAFTKRAKSEDVTIAAALEAALEASL